MTIGGEIREIINFDKVPRSPLVYQRFNSTNQAPKIGRKKDKGQG